MTSVKDLAIHLLLQAQEYVSGIKQTSQTTEKEMGTMAKSVATLEAELQTLEKQKKAALSIEEAKGFQREINKIEKEIADVNKELNKGEGLFGKLGDATSRVGKAMGGNALFGGLVGGGVATVLQSIVQRVNDIDDAGKALGNTLIASGVPMDQLDAKLQQAEGHAHEFAARMNAPHADIIKLQTGIIGITGLTGEAADKATEVAFGVEKATGGMIKGEMAAKLFAKGIADPENAESLKKLEALYPGVSAQIARATTEQERFNILHQRVSPVLQKIEQEESELWPSIEKGFASVTESALGFLASQKDTIAIIGTLGTVLGPLVAAFQKFEVLQKVSTALQWLWNAAMNANPIGLIVAGIAALVGGFILLYNNVEPVREILDSVWGGIRAAIKWVVDIYTAFDEWLDSLGVVGVAITALIMPIKLLIESLIALGDWFGDLFSAEEEVDEKNKELATSTKKVEEADRSATIALQQRTAALVAGKKALEDYSKLQQDSIDNAKAQFVLWNNIAKGTSEIDAANLGVLRRMLKHEPSPAEIKAFAERQMRALVSSVKKSDGFLDAVKTGEELWDNILNPEVEDKKEAVDTRLEKLQKAYQREQEFLVGSLGNRLKKIDQTAQLELSKVGITETRKNEILAEAERKKQAITERGNADLITVNRKFQADMESLSGLSKEDIEKRSDALFDAKKQEQEYQDASYDAWVTYVLTTRKLDEERTKAAKAQADARVKAQQDEIKKTKELADLAAEIQNSNETDVALAKLKNQHEAELALLALQGLSHEEYELRKTAATKKYAKDRAQIVEEAIKKEGGIYEAAANGIAQVFNTLTNTLKSALAKWLGWEKKEKDKESDADRRLRELEREDREKALAEEAKQGKISYERFLLERQKLRDEADGSERSKDEAMLDWKQTVGQAMVDTTIDQLAQVAQAYIQQALMQLALKQAEGSANLIASIFATIPFPLNVALAAGAFGIVAALFAGISSLVGGAGGSVKKAAKGLVHRPGRDGSTGQMILTGEQGDTEFTAPQEDFKDYAESDLSPMLEQIFMEKIFTSPRMRNIYSQTRNFGVLPPIAPSLQRTSAAVLGARREETLERLTGAIETLVNDGIKVEGRTRVKGSELVEVIRNREKEVNRRAYPNNN